MNGSGSCFKALRHRWPEAARRSEAAAQRAHKHQLEEEDKLWAPGQVTEEQLPEFHLCCWCPCAAGRSATPPLPSLFGRHLCGPAEPDWKAVVATSPRLQMEADGSWLFLRVVLCSLVGPASHAPPPPPTQPQNRFQPCVSNPTLNSGLFFKVPRCDFSTVTLKFLVPTEDWPPQPEETTATITSADQPLLSFRSWDQPLLWGPSADL